jgi:hypothetical protein
VTVRPAQASASDLPNCPQAGQLAARVSERTEEPGYVGGQQLGRLGCREVAPPRHERPALDVVEALVLI